jgi:hypothetical protein
VNQQGVQEAAEAVKIAEKERATCEMVPIDGRNQGSERDERRRVCPTTRPLSHGREASAIHEWRRRF